MKKKAEFETFESVKFLCFCLHQELRILEQVRKVVALQTSKTWRVAYPLMWAIGDSCDSVMKLAIHGKMRDCVGVSRTAFETMINVSYISALGQSAAERAESHARQKSFRDMRRVAEFKAEHLGSPHVPDSFWDQLLQGSPPLQWAIDEYTSKKGREITAWTPEGVRERIDAIATELGEAVVKSLRIALKAIYRDASEICHGTLYGAFFALGMVRDGPIKNAEQMDRFRSAYIAEMLTLLTFSLHSMLQIVSKGIPIEGEVADSREIVDRIGGTFWPTEKQSDMDL